MIKPTQRLYLHNVQETSGQRLRSGPPSSCLEGIDLRQFQERASTHALNLCEGKKKIGSHPLYFHRSSSMGVWERSQEWRGLAVGLKNWAERADEKLSMKEEETFKYTGYERKRGVKTGLRNLIDLKGDSRKGDGRGEGGRRQIEQMKQDCYETFLKIRKHEQDARAVAGGQGGPRFA